MAATKQGGDRDRAATSRLLVDQLQGLGVPAGQCLLVNSSLKSMGQIAGGAPTAAWALRRSLGTEGTLVVPAGTPDNSDTSRVHLKRIAGMTARQIARYRAAMPAFDPQTTPSTLAGRIAEAVRTSPGAVRSAHPQSSFAAIGPMARWLMADHALECHLGEASPLGRLYEADGWILLLGVGHAVCTALHLAEYRYRQNPPRRAYRCVVTRGGRPEWREFQDVVLDDRDFADLGRDLDQTGFVRRGRVAAAACRLMPMRATVDFAAWWFGQHRPG